ncbi:hypothetical protein [Nocardiopsis rhodophaea]|uniref:hypothetical protein n=1 Tax=Nocardiopsis rhodophaea TaxID=280238 RepID=UPI0031E34442
MKRTRIAATLASTAAMSGAMTLGAAPASASTPAPASSGSAGCPCGGSSRSYSHGHHSGHHGYFDIGGISASTGS